MVRYGVDPGLCAGAALECAPGLPRGAVLLEAEAGRLRTALRAVPGATLVDIAPVVLGWLASSLHPAYGERILPVQRAAARACRLWAGPHARLGVQDTLASALQYSGTLYFFCAGACVTMRAHSNVDATGMRDRVEVVGDKYDMDIGGFDVPPYAPTPATLEGGLGGRSDAHQTGHAAAG